MPQRTSKTGAPCRPYGLLSTNGQGYLRMAPQQTEYYQGSTTEQTLAHQRTRAETVGLTIDGVVADDVPSRRPGLIATPVSPQPCSASGLGRV